MPLIGFVMFCVVIKAFVCIYQMVKNDKDILKGKI